MCPGRRGRPVTPEAAPHHQFVFWIMEHPGESPPIQGSAEGGTEVVTEVTGSPPSIDTFLFIWALLLMLSNDYDQLKFCFLVQLL